MKPLGPEFFARDVHTVARELVGAALRFRGAGGLIVETEAYDAADPACHAYRGPTKRNEPLYGEPGRAYVYLNYGIHSLLNAVAQPPGEAAAVLIRALEPRWGIEQMRRRRGTGETAALCSGPGKLTQALGITLAQNRARLDREPFELFAAAETVDVVRGPRVGIRVGTELPWRYCAAGNPNVSRPRPVLAA